MIKILIISFLALTLVGCSTPPGLKTAVSPLLPKNELVAATNTTEEVKGEETADAEGVEANEPANEVALESSLPDGGHQDNTEVDHQFEGVE